MFPQSRNADDSFRHRTSRAHIRSQYRPYPSLKSRILAFKWGKFRHPKTCWEPVQTNQTYNFGGRLSKSVTGFCVHSYKQRVCLQRKIHRRVELLLRRKVSSLEKKCKKKNCYRKSCYVLAPPGAYSSPEKHGLIRERGLIWEVGLIEDLRYLFFVTANTMMQLCDVLQRMEWNNTIIMVSG